MNLRRRALLLTLALVLCLCGCSRDYTRSYQKAVDLFAAGDYAEAAKAFDRLEDYAQSRTYAAYSHGLVLFEQGQYSAAEPYFAASRDFMYGEERYQYCHAHLLMESGQYAEAAAVLKPVTGFEDAAVWREYCLARAAEIAKDYETALYGYEASVGIADAEDRLYSLRGQIYNRAITLKNEGNYQSAIILFNMLGDYLSSAAQAQECKEIDLDRQYEQADALETAGDLQGAYEIFAALASYRDAAGRAVRLADILGIELPNATGYYE